MPRQWALGLVAAMLLTSAQAEAGWQSIGQVRAETPARWEQKYETKWRAIDIDVPIEMPSVDALPVLKISVKNEPVPESRLTGYGYVEVNDGLRLSVYTDKRVLGELSLSANQRRRAAGRYDGGALPDKSPEDVDIGYVDALGLAYQEIERLLGFPKEAVRLNRVTAYDGVYHFTRDSGEIRLGKRADDRTGYWSFLFEPLYHGLTMEGCAGGNAYDDGFSLPAGEPVIRVNVWSKEAYSVLATVKQEIAIVQDDVPLRPFADAKAAIEGEIMAGRLRTINRLKLCYIPYRDPSDPDSLFLLPAWYLEGAYTQSADTELTPMFDPASGALVGYAGGVNENMIVCYEISRGRLLDRSETGDSRRDVPAIVTWDDIQ